MTHEGFPLIELLAGRVRDAIAMLVSPFTTIADAALYLSYAAIIAAVAKAVEVFKR